MQVLKHLKKCAPGKFSERGTALNLIASGEILGADSTSTYRENILNGWKEVWKPENIVSSLLLAIAVIEAPLSGMARKVGGNAVETGTTVFRSVDATEASIIKRTGKFTLQEGGLEVKYFAKTLEDAHWYGQRLYPNGYSIIQGTVKGTVNTSEYWFPHIDIGAYVFPGETLPYIIPH